MRYQVITGNNIDTLKQYPDNHFDSIITDPPYGIEFLGKDWDSNTGATETWQQCIRVLKPGGYILAFSAARTYHQLATNIESVGFEIRDQIMWIYGSGFPKAQDMGKAIQKRQGVAETKTTKGGARPSDKMAGPYAEGTEYKNTICTSPEAKQWAGWKTALKPAHEPIVMARKPFKGSCVDNVIKHGVGALNIDATRVGDDLMTIRHLRKDDGKAFTHHGDGKKNWDSYEDVGSVEGRFPSNVIGEITDEYQKYFYCPKVSRAERHIGFEAKDIPTNSKGMLQDRYDSGMQTGMYQDAKENHGGGNNHPTVKPVALMKYLITLVTPPGGHVLDPFNGSGSTGMAAVELGSEYTGCELDPAYADIACKRIEAWYHNTDISGTELPSEWFDETH